MRWSGQYSNAGGRPSGADAPQTPPCLERASTTLLDRPYPRLPDGQFLTIYDNDDVVVANRHDFPLLTVVIIRIAHADPVSNLHSAPRCDHCACGAARPGFNASNVAFARARADRAAAASAPAAVASSPASIIVDARALIDVR
jgi:hypothetical protein